MSGARKRRGTTLVELSLVIAILAMVALPFAAFVSQNLKNTVQSSTQLKEQMVLEQVMQDMGKHLRSAVGVKSDGTSCPITFPTGGISFTSSDPQPRPISDTDPLTVNTTSLYTYELRSDGLFYKNGIVFPDGLEANMITGLTFPTETELQHLPADTPPCYLTVRMEAYNPTLQTTTALQETIYLRNYTLIVDIAKILGVMAPATGAIPVTLITSTAEYTGAVAWTGALTSEGKFKNQTVYTAKITLARIGDYTLTGVAANFFTVAGTTVDATNAANSGVVTAIFPAIGATQLAIADPALTTSKPYDGNATATVTAGALSGVAGGDTVTVSAVATYDTATVGTGKTITVVYSLAGADATNYVKPVDYTVTTGVITAKALTVTATAGQSKIYGAADPTFAYTFAPALVGSDVMSGALSRATGENVGTYAITQGTLTAGTNYTITFVSSTFSVTAKSITVTAIGAITGKAKVGEELTAGALTPSGATATYQWQRASSAGGPYADITGATGTTYTLVAGDVHGYIRVVAAGTGNYSGTVTSAETKQITP